MNTRPALHPRISPRRDLVLAAILLAIAVSLAAPASPASAFSLTTCTLSLTSKVPNGAVLDTAFGGGSDATQTDPFVADWNGEVGWQGSSGFNGFKNNAWHVDVFMFPTSLRGGDANEDATRLGDGAVSAGEASFFRLTGLYYISGEFSGDAGSCEGGGWILLQGLPFVTIPFWIALVITVVGLVLLVVGYRRAWGLAIAGGVLSGIGLAFLLMMFAVMPFGAWTPYGTLATLLLVGLLVALLAARRRPRPL
jgi:hypothetical protein